MKMCRTFGIDVKLHWSMFVVLGLTAFSFIKNGPDGFSFDLPGFGSQMLLLFIVFGSVLCHELGHSLAARRVGVATKDIILTPLGGIARLDEIPRNPVHELIIVAAGPGVTLFLVVLSALGLWALNATGHPYPGARHVMALTAAINTVLFIFNAIPAFPMDGGRIFRAMMALMGVGYLKATKIAMHVGQVCAVAFVVYGVMTGSFTLVLIAVFVVLGSFAEYAGVKQKILQGEIAS